MNLYAINKNAKSSGHGMFGGVLGVIQPHIADRATLAGATQQMVAGRMALALRSDPSEALQLALTHAYNANRLGH
jgi:hypothetical protein